MSYKAVAIIDGELFDDLITIKELMEQFDEHLECVQFIHKDNLTKAKESGEFLSAPLAFLLFDIPNKDQYKNRINEAERIKSEFDIDNCILVFAASIQDVFSDDIRETKDLDYQLYEMVKTIHLVHENHEDKGLVPIKMLALVSALRRCGSDEEHIMFDRDYVTANVGCNYENFDLLTVAKFKKLKVKVDEINKELSILTDEAKQLEQHEPQKYQCCFSQVDEDLAGATDMVVPSKIDEIFNFCKISASRANEFYQKFFSCSKSDVEFAQIALYDSFEKASRKKDVDPDLVTKLSFSSGEPITESKDLLRRCVKAKTPRQQKFHELIPLFRSINDSERPSLKNVWKMLLVALAIITVAMCSYLIPQVINSGFSSISNDIIKIVAGVILMFMLAFAVAICIEFLHNHRLREYVKKVVNEFGDFSKSATSSIKEIRKYIDDFVTVSLNSFIKTKRLNIVQSEIERYKKLKKEYLCMAEIIKAKKMLFDNYCDQAIDYERVKDSDNIFEFIKQNTKTADFSEASGPKIVNNPWIKDIAFGIVIE